MRNNLKELQQVIKIKFKDKDLLLQSITHKSFDSKKNYEKLEFLGDRILGLVISDKLLQLYPNEKVGILDKKLASLVNKGKCCEVGKSLKINKFILIGNTSKNKNIIEDKIISDCCESIIGAIFLDGGYEKSKKFILSSWSPFLNISEILIVDPKTKLQEFSLKKFKSLPTYKVISNSGPRHKPSFKVGVKIKNTKYYYADGLSKKKAEQSAANLLLKTLNQS